MFQPVTQESRFAAMDAVEAVAAGKMRDGVPREVHASIEMLLERGTTTTEAVNATATAFQERWFDKYKGGNASMMMAAAVAAARMARTNDTGTPTVEDEAQAAGSFHHLGIERQERIASAINSGILLSARERHEISERYDAALRRGPVGGEHGPDGHEGTRRSIDAARMQLGIGHAEWRGPGDRGAVSFLLHVQAPAMLAAMGADYRCDPSNEQFVTETAERYRREGIGHPATIHGVRHNIALMRQMSGWLAPTLSDEAMSASSPTGPIATLADRIEEQAMTRGRMAALQRDRAGMAIA